MWQQKKSADISILRLPNALLAGIGVGIGVLALPERIPIFQIILGGMSLALIAMAGNIQNDIADMETDRWAHPERPLAGGRLSIPLARWISRGLFTGGLIAASLYNPAHFILASILVGLLALYNFYLKSYPLLGNLTVSMLCAAPLYFAEWPGLPRYTAVPAAFAFTATFIREVVKDAEDLDGDRKGNRRTFPIVFGTKTTQKLLGISFICLLLLLPLPAVLGYHWSYAVTILTGTLFFLVLSCRWIFKSQPNWLKAQKAMKGAMLLGMIALGLGLYY